MRFPFLSSGKQPNTAQRPLLWIISGGLTACFTVLWCPWQLGVCVLAAAGALLLFPSLRRSAYRLIMEGAILMGVFTVAFYVTKMTPLLRLNDRTDTISGWVESCSGSGRWYTVKVTDAQSVPVGTRVRLFCPERCTPDRYDTLSASVRLEQTPSWLWGSKVFLQGYPTQHSDEQVTVTGHLKSLPFLHGLQPARQRMCYRLHQLLPGEEGDVLGALCLGETVPALTDIKAIFRTGGLVHLLVVSGLHVTYVVTAVSLLLGRLPIHRCCKVGLTMAFVAVFMLFIGLTPSVIRAGTMCLVYLAGQAGRRRADGLNSLAFSAGLLLLCNPCNVLSPGFLLSFTATGGVLCLAGRLYHAEHLMQPASLYRRIVCRMHTGLAASLGATLPLLPLLCVYGGGFPLLTPLSNLLAVFPAGAALLCGWCGLLLSGIPGLAAAGQGVLMAAGLLARYVLRVARFFARRGLFVQVTALWGILMVGGISAGLIAGICCRNTLLRRRLLAGIAAVIVMSLSVERVTEVSAFTVRIHPAGSGVAMLIEKDRYRLLAITNSNGLAQASYWADSVGCTDVDCLVVGKGKPAYAGQLEALQEKITVKHILSVPDVGWTAGLPDSVSALTPGDYMKGAFQFTPETPSRWRVKMGETSLLICTDKAEPMPPATTADAMLFVGAIPMGGAAAVTEQAILLWQKDTPPTVTGQYPLWVLPENGGVLTTRGDGHWSASPDYVWR